MPNKTNNTIIDMMEAHAKLSSHVNWKYGTECNNWIKYPDKRQLLLKELAEDVMVAADYLVGRHFTFIEDDCPKWIDLPERRYWFGDGFLSLHCPPSYLPRKPPNQIKIVAEGPTDDPDDEEASAGDEDEDDDDDEDDEDDEDEDDEQGDEVEETKAERATRLKAAESEVNKIRRKAAKDSKRETAATARAQQEQDVAGGKAGPELRRLNKEQIQDNIELAAAANDQVLAFTEKRQRELSLRLHELKVCFAVLCYVVFGCFDMFGCFGMFHCDILFWGACVVLFRLVCLRLWPILSSSRSGRISNARSTMFLWISSAC
jgi:hypothetical protein